MTLIGIPNAALWGIITVLLRFVPYLGIVIAAAFPLALAIAVAPGWMLLVWTALLFIGIELVVANLVEPLSCLRSWPQRTRRSRSIAIGQLAALGASFGNWATLRPARRSAVIEEGSRELLAGDLFREEENRPISR